MGQLKRWLLLGTLLCFSGLSQASLIRVAYSGVVEKNFYDVTVGTVISAAFSYDPSAKAEWVLNNWRFPVHSIELSMLGEQSSSPLGYLRILDDQVQFAAGDAIWGGILPAFSNAIAGIPIRGLGFTVHGNFTANTLPQSGADFYGLGGGFFVNRSNGALFDVNHPDLLQLPPTPPAQSVAEPPVWWLLVAGLLILLMMRQLPSRLKSQQAMPSA